MAVITAASHSLTLAKALGARALNAAVARNVVSRHFNMYSLEGTGATAIDLSRFADIGLPDSISVGVPYTGEAAFGSTAVTLTPSRKAKGGTIDKDTYLRRVPGYTMEAIKAVVDQLEDISLSEEALDQGVLLLDQAFGQEVRQIVGSHREGWEYDATALFASVTASGGSTGVNATVTNVEDCIADIEGASTTPHDDIIGTLDPQQVADIRADLRGSGNSGTPFSENLATILAIRPTLSLDGLRGQLLGVPIYQFGPEVRTTANAGADVVGCFFLRGEGDPEVSGQGKPGAFAIAVGHSISIAAEYWTNSFGVRLVGDQPTAHGIRVNNWASKLVTDAP